MNPRGRMSASDRRWQERYKTIQERKWQTPGRRESRRRDRQYSDETYKVVPDESGWLDYCVTTERGSRGSIWDDVFEWYDDVSERMNGYVTTSDLDGLIFDESSGWFMYDSQSRVRDLKDDVSRWDASDLSSLFA